MAQKDGTLHFLHTVADGPCDESYGIQVAALAGLPRPVVERASDLLAFLEQQAQGAKAGRDGAPQKREVGQSSLLGYFAAAAMQSTEPIAKGPTQLQQFVLDKLLDINLDDMSPRDAYNLLEELQNRLEE